MRPSKMFRLSFLFSTLVLLAGCEEPAEFAEPVGEESANAWDNRVEGSWIAIYVDMEEWELSDDPAELPGNAVDLLAFTLDIGTGPKGHSHARLGVHGSDTSAAGIGFLSETYRLLPASVGNIFLVNATRTSSIGLFVNGFSEDGTPDIDVDRGDIVTGAYLTARLRLLESGNLELSAIFPSDLKEFFGAEVILPDGSAGHVWGDAPKKDLGVCDKVEVPIDEDCDDIVYDIPVEDMARMIEAEGDEAFTTIFEFVRAPLRLPENALGEAIE